MTYIQYHSLDNQWQEGFLIKQDEQYSYICHPICYDWLKKINKTDEIHLLHAHVLTNDFLEHRAISSPFSTLDPWIFSFSLEQDDIPYLHYTLTFFQHFFDTAHLSLTKRLEYAVFRCSVFIPKPLLGRLLTFIMNNYKEDPERIRLMFHPVIQKYI